MQYGLRTNIHLATWRDFLPELIALCHEAHIDEVLLSEESYQIATVVQSEEYFHQIADAYCEIVPILKREGITPSFYIKVSMGHYEGNVEGVPDFTRFVGERLKPAPTTPCGMDRRWQEYIARVCADCARAGFARMYLDDDFRSVNHDGGQTGCFCPLHVSATAKKCGLPLTAQSLKGHLCGNSEEDRRVRLAWMDVNFENQLETGRMVECAVHAVDPDIRIGLMCCGDSASCVQGRDVPLLLRTFAGEGRAPLARPAGGAYSDTLLSGVDAMYLGTARFLSESDADLTAVSEVDSYPRTVMSKSVRQTDLHIQLHALAGCHQATLNLFDHFETPFSYTREYVDMLRDRRALYDRVEAFREGCSADGVFFPWRWSVSRTIENRSGSIHGLYPYSTIADPASVFARMGVPLAFGRGEVNFLDGDMVNAMTQEEIRWLLSEGKGLFLDKFAAETLCRMGLGQEIGIGRVEYVEEACYERFDQPGFDGGCPGQYVAAYSRGVGDELSRPLRIGALPGAMPASTLIDRAKAPFAPGTLLYENAHGTRVCVFAATLDGNRGWFYKCRAGQVRSIVQWMRRGGETFCVENGLNVLPILLKDGAGKVRIALLNPSLDDASPRLDSARTFRDAMTGEPVSDINLPAMSIRYLIEE